MNYPIIHKDELQLKDKVIVISNCGIHITIGKVIHIHKLGVILQKKKNRKSVLFKGNSFYIKTKYKG